MLDLTKLLGESVTRENQVGTVVGVSGGRLTIEWTELAPTKKTQVVEEKDLSTTDLFVIKGESKVAVSQIAATPLTALVSEMEGILALSNVEAADLAESDDSEEIAPLDEARQSKGFLFKKKSKGKKVDKKADKKSEKPKSAKNQSSGAEVKSAAKPEAKPEAKKEEPKKEAPKGSSKSKSSSSNKSHNPFKKQATNGPSGVPPAPPRHQREVHKTGEWKCTRAGKLRQICTYLPTGRKKTVKIDPGYRKAYNKNYKRVNGHG